MKVSQQYAFKMVIKINPKTEKNGKISASN